MGYQDEDRPKPATMPPPAGEVAEEEWRVAMIKKMDKVEDEVKALGTLVRDLTAISHRVFDKMLEVLADNAKLRGEHEALKDEHGELRARVKLLEGVHAPDA